MENFDGHDIYPHNINKHSCTYQSLPEHQVSKICEYLTKRHIKSSQHMGILHAFSKSNQHMGIHHAFSNCVNATSNHGLSPSEVDWGDPKREPTKHGPSLMEVDLGRKMLNYTSSGCMLMEVDGGHKLRVSSVVDWGAHETHPHGYSITEVDWGGHDTSSNHMNEFLFSEVD